MDEMDQDLDQIEENTETGETEKTSEGESETDDLEL